jgi:hypothetical protein
MRLDPISLHSHHDGSPSVRELVIALVEEGRLSASAAGGQYGVPVSTERAWLQKYCTKDKLEGAEELGYGMYPVKLRMQH